MMKEILFGCERYKNKTINCLGDSITSDYSDDNSSWVEMIHRALPVKKINNYGIAGTTVADDCERDDCFVKRFLDMDNSADVIIVFGGINDFNRSIPLGDLSSTKITEFYGALKILCRGLIKKYPESDIFFITPMHAFGFKDYPHWNTKNKAGNILREYRNAIINVCEYYSVPVLDLFSSSGITPDVSENKELMLPDGLHPGKKGRNKIARKILNFLLYTL